jgi:hypothetical protein
MNESDPLDDLRVPDLHASAFTFGGDKPPVRTLVLTSAEPQEFRAIDPVTRGTRSIRDRRSPIVNLRPQRGMR